IDIYRLVEESADPLGLPAEIFTARATIIASIPGEQIPVSRSTVTYVDPLEMKSIRRGIRYRYAVRVINLNGAASDLSNYVTILPLADVAAPPNGLGATQQEREIVVTWQAPTANSTGSTPVNLAGYNLYRRVAGSKDSPLRLNNTPLKDPVFRDQSFQFGVSYEYLVRAISQPPTAAPDNVEATAIESDESPVLLHLAQDTFPPAAPTAVTIASINRVVSLFWPLNVEADVAGYHIYRAEEENGQPSAWRRLNPQLHQSGAWRDDRVVVGRTYLYQITAVDRFGNESARSETVRETVNQ
ncbi:MAG: fibronectin type III domain-containing protein, partial [Acidobacteriota bacterium]